MRGTHRENLFHRIERWNGSYFRPAALSEAGTYLLVRHHTGEGICEYLKKWCDMLDSAETRKDQTEEDELRRFVSAPEKNPEPGQDHNPFWEEDDDIEFDMEGEAILEDDLDDEKEEDIEEGEEQGFPDFDVAGVDPAVAALSLGTRHRVVHTNGLHHISMVSCQCKGEEVLPRDLIAAHLLPTSLKRIRTIFTAQVLDQYRFCNLELKSSAYQFYQMLRRLTRPMAPAEVDDLYRELRRMSRIWRWMKKLKWSGYAGSSKKVKDVGPGELAIFCPACPQQGINIPDNWREDKARHVSSNSTS
jgi:hypothetical protein